VSAFVDTTLVRLSTTDGLRNLVVPPDDTARTRIRALLAEVYRLPDAAVHDVAGVSVQSVTCQQPLFPQVQRIGNWMQTIPAHTRTDFTIEGNDHDSPQWMDVDARLTVDTVLAIDPGEVESWRIGDVGDFATLDEFRAKFTYFDLDAFLAEHHISTVDQLKEAFHYLRGEIRLKPAPPFDPVAPANPYARTKYICEQLLGDACARYPELSVIALRYFNPIGAHPSGEIGEDPLGVPNNVLPYMAQVAVGRLTELAVFGDDYPTPDGTGVRDYIHVADVADGHRVAIDHLDDESGLRVFNLGTGRGASVLELLAEFERAVGRSIPYTVVARRAGDVPTLIANPERVQRAWGWKTSRGLAEMCADAWRFQRLHPDGYAS